MTDRLPTIPKHLLTALEGRFPPLAVTSSMTHAEIMYAAGERNVIRLLRQTWEEQNNPKDL